MRKDFKAGMLYEATDAANHCLQDSPTLVRILSMREHPSHERTMLSARELFQMYVFLTASMEGY